MAESDIQKEKALDLLGDLTTSFGETERPQYVHDLPIRLNVWRAFAESPYVEHSLLIAPNNRVQIALALTELRAAFVHAGHKNTSLIAIKNMIWTQTSMEQFFKAILPSTCWFQKISKTRLSQWKKSFHKVEKAANISDMQIAFREAQEKDLWRLLAGWSVIHYSHSDKDGDIWSRLEKSCTALLAITRVENSTNLDADGQDRIVTHIKTSLQAVSVYIKVLEGIAAQAEVASIWAVDLNRRAELATNVSRNTVKIDAAERLFEGTTKAVNWAVIDSGVDATHPAFLNSEAEHDNSTNLIKSRVVATYDFNRLMLLSKQRYTELVPEDVLKDLDKLHKPKNRKNPRSLEEAVLMRLFQLNAPRVPTLLSQRSLEKCLDDTDFSAMVRDYIEDVKRKITVGEPIDWALLEPLLRVPHTEDCYIAPLSGHGTHVAGIIAGNLPAGVLKEPGEIDNSNGSAMPERAIRGMCPDMKIYDLRVCDKYGRGDEFLVVSALQFIDYLNKSQDRVVVHGANISLQIHHLVRNYGCGQTPVCREANNLVANGVVVVAAAGNRGYNKVQTEDGPVDTYSWSSITDPGNAKDVITVGSTHRQNPFSYGVSYFSSRGPTGDGRSKPDLVAPGEKIVAPLPNGKIGTDSGTSMAAPHVSGSAAQLLARYPELVGDPLRVKQILCDTATDLGRRREFQGAGLVNVLRALQSL